MEQKCIVHIIITNAEIKTKVANIIRDISKKELLENKVLEIGKRVLTSDNIKKIADEVCKLSQNSPYEREIKTLNKKIKKNDKELQNLLKALKSGNIIKTIVDEIGNLENKQESLKEELRKKELMNCTFTKEEVIDFLNSFISDETNSYNLNKSIINILINKVIVNTKDKKITVVYNAKTTAK